MYFTSYAEYAFNQYAKKNEKDEKALLLCILVPGNIFPVIEDPFDEEDQKKKEQPQNKKETLKGKPCRTGYQSHYTIVNFKNFSLKCR
jgi:hypothetical protein